MREHDKQVDGRDLEQEEMLRESELEKDDDEALPELIEEEEQALASGERELVFEAMCAIVERRPLLVDDLALPALERRALAALQAAVDGRDGQLGTFVYAGDRKELLEQALAVLQPNLAGGELDLQRVIQRVGELRGRLASLVDAQDELLEANTDVGVVKTDGEHGDKPEEPEGEDKKSTLSEGPEVIVENKTSMLGEDEQEREPERELEREQQQEHEQDSQTKKPWWRRPFG